MKTKALILVSIMLFAFIGLKAQTQQTAEVAPIISFDPNPGENEDIDIKEYNGNIYITMVMGTEEISGFYTFERSYDMENFVILSKKSFAPHKAVEKELFSFVNKLPKKKATYRVYKFTPSKVSLMAEYKYNEEKSQYADN